MEMETNEPQEFGRLALRVEGEWWVAYYAMPETMEGAVILATIRMSVAQNPERKAAFMALMRDLVADIIENTTGQRPTWKPTRLAPEHERSGRA